MPINNRILSNGIRLVTEPIAATKAAAIGFWFSGGSRDEPESLCGITHYLEHLLFKGTPSRSATELARYFDRIGGYANAFTERELVCLYCVVPAPHAREALSVLADMAFSSVLSDEETERERSVIESEILSSLDDPDECGMDAALQFMYPDHPFARPIAGTIESLRGISPESIREFYRTRFSRCLSLVAVSGDIGPDGIAADLERLVCSGTPAASAFPAVSSPPGLHTGRGYFRSSFRQAQIFLSFEPQGDPSSANGDFARFDGTEWFSWAAINAIIGDTVSSRLFQSLREKRGLCYSVYSFYQASRDSRIWTACVSTPPEKTAEVVAVLLDEMSLLARNGISPLELEDAKLHIAGETVLAAEDTENRMRRLARQFFFGGRIDDIETSLAVLDGITQKDISERVSRTFAPERMSLVVYAGKKEIKECRRKWP